MLLPTVTDLRIAQNFGPANSLPTISFMFSTNMVQASGCVLTSRVTPDASSSTTSSFEFGHPHFQTSGKQLNRTVFFSNPEQRLESILLLIPDASRWPLITITSRPIALSLGNRDIFKLLDSETETRERGWDIWEPLAKILFFRNGWRSDYQHTRIGSSTSESIRHSIYDTGHSLSSFTMNTYPRQHDVEMRRSQY